MASWIILRTNGKSTLPLADALSQAGHEVWTPVQIRIQRAPRRRAKTERSFPLTPGFIFAQAHTLPDLVELSQTPNARFSVFHHYGRIPLIADHELEPLRSEERRIVPKARQHIYQPGDKVRTPEGSFAGMTGTILTADHKTAEVDFGGRLMVKIGAFLLRPDSAYEPAALAA